MQQNDPGPISYAGHTQVMERLAREAGLSPTDARAATQGPALRAIDQGTSAVSSVDAAHRQAVFDQQIKPAVMGLLMQTQAALHLAQHVASHYGLRCDIPTPAGVAAYHPERSAALARAPSENWYGQRPSVGNPWRAQIRPNPGPDWHRAMEREGGAPISPIAAQQAPPVMPGANPWETIGANDPALLEAQSTPLGSRNLQAPALPPMMDDEGLRRMMGAPDPSQVRPPHMPFEAPAPGQGPLPWEAQAQSPFMTEAHQSVGLHPITEYQPTVPNHLKEPPTFDVAPAQGQGESTDAGDGGQGQRPDDGGAGPRGPGGGGRRRGR